MQKIYLIFTKDGDVFCAANSYELAAEIALDEYNNGSLEEGYMIEKCNLFDKFQV